MSCCRKSRTTRMTSWPTWSASRGSATGTMPSCRRWPKPKPPWSFCPWMEISAWTSSSPGIHLGLTLCQPTQKTKVRGQLEQEHSGLCLYSSLMSCRGIGTIYPQSHAPSSLFPQPSVLSSLASCQFLVYMDLGFVCESNHVFLFFIFWFILYHRSVFGTKGMSKRVKLAPTWVEILY